MINGTHILFYTNDADADRAFLRDVLGFASVDVGRGWLIFKLPPAEAAVHPMDESQHAMTTELYFMCDDVRAEVAALEQKGAQCDALVEEQWGIRTAFRLPSGGKVGLYQPKHPTALNLG